MAGNEVFYLLGVNKCLLSSEPTIAVHRPGEKGAEIRLALGTGEIAQWLRVLTAISEPLKFGSQNPQGVSQTPATKGRGDPMSSSGLIGHQIPI